MNFSNARGFASQSYGTMAILLIALPLFSSTVLLGQQAEQTSQPVPEAAAAEAPKIPNDQLDSLVAPIALYPDPLLAQTLAASTYPLEIIQLQQWMDRNKSLKDQALAGAVEKQNWDPSIQAMAAFPDVVKRLAENVQWTSDLGNAFLAQQSDVMEAVQRMRAKAQGAGNLKASKEQNVETKTVEGKQVIVIEQANPKVVYVPTYKPVVVYGAPVYPYPPIVYPPYYGALAFGAGVALGYAWGGGWGWGCGWGRQQVTVNYNNKYVNNWNRNTNINRNNFNRPSQLPTNGGAWQHNPQHRGNAPYGNRQTANRYANNARQLPAGGTSNRPGAGGAGTMDRPVGAGNRPGTGGSGTMNRPGAGGNPPRGGGAATMNRPGGSGAGTADRVAGGGGNGTNIGRGSGGGERIGNHSASPGAGFGSNNALGGGGFNGNAARASSNRGTHSFGGGGFRGGGHLGGGGRRR